MRRRIFIAIGIPDDVRGTIAEAIKKWQWLPIRWTAPENWHVTFIPPFYATDKELMNVTGAVRSAAKDAEPFELIFRSIILAPPGKRARMIWLIGPESQKLQEFKNQTDEAIEQTKIIPNFEKEERPVTPHITLARFREGDLKDLEEKTKTLEDLHIAFDVSGLDIMESHLKSSGAEYECIETVAFGEAGTSPLYEFLPHTADVRMKVYGKTHKEIFQNALLGMASFMKEGALHKKLTVKHSIEIKADGATTLLVDFLSEVLTLADTHQEVYPFATFDECSEARLKGTISGAPVDAFDKDIKAVTYHGAQIQKTSSGFEATIIFDI